MEVISAYWDVFKKKRGLPTHKGMPHPSREID